MLSAGAAGLLQRSLHHIIRTGRSGTSPATTATYICALDSACDVCVQGKTATARVVCSHLVSTAHDPTATIASKIEKRLTRCNVILEAFGHASTSRNPSSSRFINYTKIYIHGPDSRGTGTRAGGLCGAAVGTFLLEAARVVRCTRDDDATEASSKGGGRGRGGDCNFRILYEILAAWPEIGRREGEEVNMTIEDLQWESDYRILPRGEAQRGDACRRDLQRRFTVTEDALMDMGCDERQLTALWTVLGVVILLGEVLFEEEESLEGLCACVAETSMNTCYTICRLLGISLSQLVEVLTQRVLWARGECFVMTRSGLEAYHARDAICTALYHHAFSYVVGRVNEALTPDGSAVHGEENAEARHLPFIGILDMFGMEMKETNRLEPLLINYCNEVLHNEFNRQIFEDEVTFLDQEGIECPVRILECPSNSLCVDMLHGGSEGGGARGSIFSILDAAGRYPNPLDSKFCRELHRTFGRDDEGSNNETYAKCFPPPLHADKRRAFVIRHFTGSVQYSVGDRNQWVSGNVASVPDGLDALLQFSPITMLHTISSSSSGGGASSWGTILEESDQRKAGCGAARKRPSRLGGGTLASQSVSVMKGLAVTLRATVCSHILCIKPNADAPPQAANVFQQRYVLQQIRSLGCVKACEIMKLGLPERISFTDLKNLWSHLLRDVEDHCAQESDDVVISLMLQALGIPSQAYRLGKCHVLFEKGGLWRLHSAVKSCGVDSTELLLHFRDSLNRRKDMQALQQVAGDEVARVEAFVADGKAELHARQQEITSALQSDGSGCVGSVSLSIQVNEMHSAVESLACALELSEKKIVALQQFAAGAIGKKDKSFQKKLVSLTEQLVQHRDCYDVLLEEYERLETLSTKSVSSRLTDGALVRWQTATKADELVQRARGSVESMRTAIGRCQLDIARQLADKCSELVAQVDSDMREVMLSAAEAVSQIDAARSEQVAFVRDMKALIEQAESLADSFQELTAKCDAAERKALKVNVSPTPRTGINSPRDSDSASVDASRVGRTGSMRLNPGDHQQLLHRTSPECTPDTYTRTGSHGLSDSDDDFSLIAVDMWIVPEGWEEVFDVTTQRPFFFNTITQMSQWERPTGPAQSIGGQLLVTPEATSQDSTECASSTSTLPRTHRRVLNSTIDVALADVIIADSESPLREVGQNVVQDVDLSVSDLTGSDNTLSPLPASKASGEAPDLALPAMVIAAECEGGKGVPSADPSDPSAEPTSAVTLRKTKQTAKCNLTYGRITTSQLDELGVALKRGFLLMKSGFLSRWKKRYFVLEGPRLSCFKDIDGYYNGSVAHKMLNLTKQSVTAYTSTRYTFSVQSSSGVGIARRQEEWLLVAESEEAMRQWVAHVNAHIHILHRKSEASDYDSSCHTSDRFWLEGLVETTFWRVPARDSEKHVVSPVLVLTMPYLSAPRTGEAIHPGEYVEVVQEVDVQGQLFLRLADDRGWVNAQRPKGTAYLLQRTRECLFQKEEYRVVVDDGQVTSL